MHTYISCVRNRPNAPVDFEQVSQQATSESIVCFNAPYFVAYCLLQCGVEMGQHHPFLRYWAQLSPAVSVQPGLSPLQSFGLVFGCGFTQGGEGEGEGEEPGGGGGGWNMGGDGDAPGGGAGAAGGDGAKEFPEIPLDRGGAPAWVEGVSSPPPLAELRTGTQVQAPQMNHQYIVSRGGP